MCGIAGWVSYDGDVKAQWDVIATMTETMALRGPDAKGMFIDRHVGLGHRRLAVIDLAGGVQPMQAEEEGRVVASLVYTGGVYNFVELREELKRLGHHFKTCSDTEVVLRGYLQWGDEVAERLNGMFAFAIWDVVTKELFLVRDRMGVKPLFYYPTADGVLFGSEPKAILAHPSVRPRVNMDGLREMLVLAKNPEVTIYAGMCEVRPGQVVRVNHDGITKRRYWMLTAREHEDDLPRTIRTVAELLEDIIQRQIVADVPLCSLLSGGLDSSSVTALAHRAIFIRQGGRIRSFSVDFADHGADFVANDIHRSSDTPFVRDFVAQIGCDHTEVVIDSRELADRELNRAVIRARDFPLSLSGDMFSSLYRLFEAVRAESTVALSGESADEVFGGYSWFHDPKAIEAATFPWLVTTGGTFDGTQVLDADLLARLKLPKFAADSYAQAGRDPGPRQRGRGRASHAGDQLSAPDPLRAVSARPQGPHEHGGRARGSGAVLRPPPGRIRVQHSLASQDVRWTGKEHSSRGHARAVAGLDRQSSEEPLSLDPGSGLRESRPCGRRRDAGGPIPSRSSSLQQESAQGRVGATDRKHQLAPRPCRPRACALDRRLGERLWCRAEPLVPAHVVLQGRLRTSGSKRALAL
jgi:asparagine synthase (glutamine-hydrolysing)